jgi:hypothetical protein
MLLIVKCHYASYSVFSSPSVINKCKATITQAKGDGCPLILVYSGQEIVYQAINKKRFADARRIMAKAGIKPILGAWVNGKPRPVETEAEIKAGVP